MPSRIEPSCRGDDAAVGVDEVHVHAAELLDVPQLLVVEEDDLVAALCRGLLLGDEGRRVVAAGLGRAHAAAAGAGVVGGEPQRDRHRAALEVGARRAGDHHERDVLGRPDAEERLGGDHERTQVEALLARGVGHPALVDADQRLDRLHEVARRAARGGRGAGWSAPSARRSPRGGTPRSLPSSWR